MKLSTGETCRKCKPDTGACDKHLHLDPSYQANVVKPQAAQPWGDWADVAGLAVGLALTVLWAAW